MATDLYFDARSLRQPTEGPAGCPVSGCDAPLKLVDSQWGEMPYCPVHCIRIHTKTFAYYNGSDATSRRGAALRNIRFERPYFDTHFLGNAAKAETHRICNENSEDALTWNALSGLANGGVLSRVLSSFTSLPIETEPELYLWGLRANFGDSSAPSLFAPLARARSVFERGISKFLTEPDIMLYLPGQILVLVEAKFTSGNGIASGSDAGDVAGEKPKSREGVLKRYSPSALPDDTLLQPAPSGHFYSQLYRNLVFAIHMANELGVKWGLVNLVCEGQSRLRQPADGFADPTPFMRTVLPAASHSQFLYYTWERLYADHIANAPQLQDLREYLYNKTASRVRALAIQQ